MKANILTIALAAAAFSFVACKPKGPVTEEKVKAEGDKVAEGVTNIVESGTEEVEPAPTDAAPGPVAPAGPAPTEPAPE